MAENRTGPREGLEGAVEGVKGKAKEVAGTVVGNNDLRDEGIAQQDKAESQREVAQKEAEAEKARSEADVQELRQRSHQGR
ncbi:microaggregate-binding protein 1 [Nocardia sp. NBC_01329]|uniref:microaggregate-binding protein 1 n=1 Tax=Nocardia sp. NBC_01329 TaxID=2903594 RepID=UPI002E0F033E|nr:CsbD family protein [Nocardia sp. NBC_01329]